MNLHQFRLFSSRTLIRFFLIFFISIPSSAFAIPYLYTYTSTPLRLDIPGSIWTDPANLAISFVLDPGTISGSYDNNSSSLLPFTITAGPASIIVNGNDPSVTDVYENFTWNAMGQLTSWEFGATETLPGGLEYTLFSSLLIPESSAGTDSYDSIYGGFTGGIFAPSMNNPGTWVATAVSPNPVPEPATLFLITSGLFGFAAAKMRKRS